MLLLDPSSSIFLATQYSDDAILTNVAVVTVMPNIENIYEMYGS